MPDIKNYDINDKDLKGADAEKSSGTVLQLSGLDLGKSRKSDSNPLAGKQTARKRLPIVIDIIIALLFVALFAGAIVGAYFAFRSFAVDFESVDVEYTMLVAADEDELAAVADQLLYMDVNGSVEYFGKIKSATYSSANGAWLVTVSATVKYKEGEGYAVGNQRLAVGQSLSLRTENGRAISGTVVELYDSKFPVSAKAGLPVTIKLLEAEGGR